MLTRPNNRFVEFPKDILLNGLSSFLTFEDIVFWLTATLTSHQQKPTVLQIFFAGNYDLTALSREANVTLLYKIINSLSVNDINGFQQPLPHRLFVNILQPFSRGTTVYTLFLPIMRNQIDYAKKKKQEALRHDSDWIRYILDNQENSPLTWRCTQGLILAYSATTLALLILGIMSSPSQSKKFSDDTFLFAFFWAELPMAMITFFGFFTVGVCDADNSCSESVMGMLLSIALTAVSPFIPWMASLFLIYAELCILRNIDKVPNSLLTQFKQLIRNLHQLGARATLEECQIAQTLDLPAEVLTSIQHPNQRNSTCCSSVQNTITATIVRFSHWQSLRDEVVADPNYVDTPINQV